MSGRWVRRIEERLKSKKHKNLQLDIITGKCVITIDSTQVFRHIRRHKLKKLPIRSTRLNHFRRGNLNFHLLLSTRCTVEMSTLLDWSAIEFLSSSAKETNKLPSKFDRINRKQGTQWNSSLGIGATFPTCMPHNRYSHLRTKEHYIATEGKY